MSAAGTLPLRRADALARDPRPVPAAAAGVQHRQGGTTAEEHVVPVVPEARAGTTGTTTMLAVVPALPRAEAQHGQALAASGTTGTTGTTRFEVIPAPEVESGPDDDGAFEERAAMVEVGAGVPRAWAEGFARLDLAAPAPGFSPERWRRLVDVGGRFLDRWGARAAALGWSAVDVFGVHLAAASQDHDAMGLVALIGDGEVVAITDVSATIRDRCGHELVYLRRARPGAVALWEAAPQG